MAWSNFLDLRSLPVKEAEAVILPIPYEATITYGGGTREGPEAILAASRQVELWDEEYDWDPRQAIRLATAAPGLPGGFRSPGHAGQDHAGWCSPGFPRANSSPPWEANTPSPWPWSRRSRPATRT